MSTPTTPPYPIDDEVRAIIRALLSREPTLVRFADDCRVGAWFRSNSQAFDRMRALGILSPLRHFYDGVYNACRGEWSSYTTSYTDSDYHDYYNAGLAYYLDPANIFAEPNADDNCPVIED